MYHVHQLFYYLTQYLPKDKQISNPGLAEEQISSDIYNYFSGLGCKYHDWYDIPRYCSLSWVKRWAYLMMDECCPPLCIEKKKYTHIPIEQKIFKNVSAKLFKSFFSLLSFYSQSNNMFMWDATKCEFSTMGQPL